MAFAGNTGYGLLNPGTTLPGTTTPSPTPPVRKPIVDYRTGTGPGSTDPTKTPIPGADLYASADVMATNAYNKALTQINQNRLNTLTSYGYTGTVDPSTGAVSGVTIDPNSIYGAAQQLFHSQAVEDRNAQNAAMDRGLFGGLAHQAGSELHYQHGAARTTLGSDLQDKLGSLDMQQQSTAEARDNALWQAEQGALATKMQNDYNTSIQDLLKQLLNSGSGSDGGKQNSDNPPGSKTPAPIPAPVTRSVGGLTIPESAFWKLKGVVGPGNDEKTKAVKKILGGRNYAAA